VLIPDGKDDQKFAAQPPHLIVQFLVPIHCLLRTVQKYLLKMENWSSSIEWVRSTLALFDFLKVTTNTIQHRREDFNLH
jgi:hypothetical protein